MDIYWFDDGGGVRLPKTCLLKYWDGQQFVSVKNPSGLGLKNNCFNTMTFDEVKTTKLRLELVSNGAASTGILQWKVYDSGKSPNFAPTVTAGVDRTVVLGGKTYLKRDGPRRRQAQCHAFRFLEQGVRSRKRGLCGYSSALNGGNIFCTGRLCSQVDRLRRGINVIFISQCICGCAPS